MLCPLHSPCAPVPLVGGFPCLVSPLPACLPLAAGSPGWVGSLQCQTAGPGAKWQLPGPSSPPAPLCISLWLVLSSPLLAHGSSALAVAKSFSLFLSFGCCFFQIFPCFLLLLSISSCFPSLLLPGYCPLSTSFSFSVSLIPHGPPYPHCPPSHQLSSCCMSQGSTLHGRRPDAFSFGLACQQQSPK